MLQGLHLFLGKRHLTKRNLDKALKYFKKLNMEGLNTIDKIIFADILHETDSSNEALAILDQVIAVQKEAYAYERRAHVLRELYREEEALKDLDEAIKLDSEKYMYWYTRGITLQDLGRYAEAIKDLEECIKREPESSVISTKYELGMCYFLNREYEEAVKVFKHVLSFKNKEIPIYYYWLSKILEEMNQIDEAIDYIKKGIMLLDTFESLPDQGAKELFIRGKYGVGAFQNHQREIEGSHSFRLNLTDLYLKKEEYENAIQAISDGLRLYPESEGLFLKRGNIYQLLQRWELAESDYNRALQLNQDFLEVYLEKANLYHAQKLEDKANQAIQDLLEKDPDSPIVLYWIVDFYKRNEQFAKSLSFSNMLIEREADDPVNYIQLAEIHEAAGRLLETVDAYSQAIQLNDTVDLRMRRSYKYYILEKYEEALLDLQRAEELDKEILEDSSYHNGLGLVFEAMNQRELSIESYTKAIQLESSIPRYYENRANAYLELEELDKAIQDCNQGLIIDSAYTPLLSLRGYIHYLKQDYDKSKADAIRFIDLLPNDPIGYFNLGIVYYEKEEKELALQTFSHVLSIDPTHARSYLYIAYLFYDSYELDACIDNLVSWNLYYMREGTIEKRSEALQELSGLDEYVISKANEQLLSLLNNQKYLS